MIVYGSTMSPFVRKVMAFTVEKGIAVELKQVGLGSDDAGFRAASPFGKMPALEDGDFRLADSSAIIHYLEALHPDPALVPAEPRARGMTIWYDEIADTILGPIVRKMFFNRIVSPRFLKQPGDLAAADQAEAEELPPVCAWLEGEMKPSGFLVEDRLTLADLSVASPFVNYAHAGFVPDPATHPKLTAYLAAIHARPCFARMIAGEQRALRR